MNEKTSRLMRRALGDANVTKQRKRAYSKLPSREKAKERARLRIAAER